MRFRYLKRGTPAMANRLRLEAQFDQFWSTFRDRVGEIEGWLKSRGPLAEFMHDALPLTRGDLPESLEWEVGPSADGEWKLVICTGGRRELRAMCDRLIEMAPLVPGWHFAAYRQPEPVEVAPLLLDGRRGVPLPEASFRVGALSNGRLDLECFAAINGEADDAANGSVLVLGEILIGEEDFDRWIGPIGLTPLRKRGLLRRRESPPTDAISMGDLRVRVLAEIARVRSRLPDRPRLQLDHQGWASANASSGEPKPIVAGDTGWTCFDLQPTPLGADGDAAGTTDQFVAVMREAPLFLATRSPGFDSSRYSLFDECFAYVKADRAGFAEDAESRGNVEERIDAALRSAGVGCTWGGGSGLRYAYFDLALLDVPKAIDVLRETIGTPARAWLLFHDAELAEEYVDLVGDDEPPPQAGKER